MGGAARPYKKVIKAYDYPCGIKLDGTMDCFGQFTAKAPSGIADYIIGPSRGYVTHNCILTGAGNITCYGPEAKGCFAAPPGPVKSPRRYRRPVSGSTYL